MKWFNRWDITTELNWCSEKVNMHQSWQVEDNEYIRIISSALLVSAHSTAWFHIMHVCCYILTPTGFSSRNWNGTWRLTLLCSTTRWPRRCDAPTTRTVSPLSRTTSPLASSEIMKSEYVKRKICIYDMTVCCMGQSHWHIDSYFAGLHNMQIYLSGKWDNPRRENQWQRSAGCKIILDVITL